MSKKFKCVLCNNEYTGHGNNPEPVKEEGECCDNCNMIHVIPARLKVIKESYKSLSQ